jgi:hypothetical protein
MVELERKVCGFIRRREKNKKIIGVTKVAPKAVILRVIFVHFFSSKKIFSTTPKASLLSQASYLARGISKLIHPKT